MICSDSLGKIGKTKLNNVVEPAIVQSDAAKTMRNFKGRELNAIEKNDYCCGFIISVIIHLF